MPTSLMLLSNPFRPDPRVLQEARALTGAGFAVRLVAWDRDSGTARRSSEHGIVVERLGPACPFRSPSMLLTRLPRFWSRALAAARDGRFDIVHSHDLDTLPVGMLIARLHGKRVLYDAHELYAKMIEKEVGPVVAGLVWRLERFLARRADGVVTVSEAMAKVLSEGRATPARIVTTSPDPSVAADADPETIRAKYGMKGFTVSYLGSLEPGRFVEELAGAFAPGDGITVLFAGSGTLREKVEQAARERPNVRYLGTVDTDEALRITRASDAVVAMMDPSDPINRVGTPGKVINAMALGRPVIVTEGVDIAKRVAEAGCGLVVPYDAKAFAETVRRFSRDPGALAGMGQKGFEHYGKHLSWASSRDQLLDAYRALAGPTS